MATIGAITAGTGIALTYIAVVGFTLTTTMFRGPWFASIGQGATIGARSGVMRDVPPGETQIGTPAYEVGETLRQVAALRKLPDWMRKASRIFKVHQHDQ